MEEAFGSEQLVLCHDRVTGMKAAIAVDDTTLGPGLGGVRWAPYPSAEAAVVEARRLAAGMTLKHAAAGLPYGGGKAVIMRDDPPGDRRAVMEAFGRFVARLGGSYIPGVDMGTTVEDLGVVARIAPDVACDAQDPSPLTAVGVHHGIRAAVAHTFGSRGLDGVRVAVQGVGHVGEDLAVLLAKDGARLAVADLDAGRARAVADRVGGEVVAPDAVLTLACDVLAPCASARVITDAVVPTLRARIVAGGSNDTLAHRDVADRLVEQGITYVPDFLINAGGVIHIHALRAGWDVSRLDAELAAIGDRVAAVLRRADEQATTPLAAAEAVASERVGRPVGIPA